jgi:hypothetical protein
MRGDGMKQDSRDWHEANRMPPRATLDERVAWHLAHLKACACRTDLPASIVAELTRRGQRVPAAGGGRRAVPKAGA